MPSLFNMGNETAAESEAELPEELKSLTGKIPGAHSTKYHKDNYWIGKIQLTQDARSKTIYLRKGAEVGVKGTLVTPVFGVTYTFVGNMEPPHPKFGYTLKFDTYSIEYPKDTEGIKIYITATAKWIGPTVAQAIVDAYGTNAVAVLKNEPERVAAEISGITLPRAQEIADNLKANEESEAVELELRRILGPAGVNARQFKAILDRYGKRAPEVVKGNPYELCREISGIGFITADQIALIQGLPKDKPERINACIDYVLAESEDRDGNTCTPRVIVLRDAAAKLGLGQDLVVEEVELMIRRNELRAVMGPGAFEPDIYRTGMYFCEHNLAVAVLTMLEDVDVEKVFMEAESERHRRRGLDILDAALDSLPAAILFCAEQSKNHKPGNICAGGIDKIDGVSVCNRCGARNGDVVSDDDIPF